MPAVPKLDLNRNVIDVCLESIVLFKIIFKKRTKSIENIVYKWNKLIRKHVNFCKYFEILNNNKIDEPITSTTA